MLNRYDLTKKFDEQTILASWERLMGKPVARHTTRLYIRDKVLFVHLDSPAIKQDLSFSKPQMMKILEAEFGPGVVGEIVLM